MIENNKNFNTQKSVSEITLECFKPLKIKDLENITPCWLIDGFLLKESLVMVYAKAGSGKSLISLAIAQQLLIEGKIERVLYLDGDNTPLTLKERGFDFVLETQGMNYVPIEANGRGSRLFEKMNKAKRAENTLIVIDSIRNFIDCDMRDDCGVTRFLHKLQDLRRLGATIIFFTSPAQAIWRRK